MGPELTKKPNGSPTAVRWIVLAIVAFASASAYLTRHCISAANTTIQQDLGFNDAQMGRLMSAFALGYLLCQIPGGWVGNRFGTRLAFALLSIFWSLCNVWSAVASAFLALWASRFSLGVFQAGLVPVSAKVVGDWIPVRARGVSSAWITASMSIGGAFAMWLTGRLLSEGYGWRMVFAGYATVGVVWSIGFYWYFRTLPKDHGGVNEGELKLIVDAAQPNDVALQNPRADKIHDRDSVAAPKTVGKGPMKSNQTLLVDMLASPGMWGICVQSFFRAAGYTFFVTWFFAFLEYAYDIDKAEAGMLNSLPLLAVVVGSLMGGVIVDGLLKITGSRWCSRTGTAIVALTVCGLLTMASAWTSSATQLSVVIAAGALFSGIGAPAAWAATIDIGGRRTAVVMGVMNMSGCVAGVILPTLLGGWFDTIRETGGDWNLVIYLHAGFYFAGAVGWLAVHPDREV